MARRNIKRFQQFVGNKAKENDYGSVPFENVVFLCLYAQNITLTFVEESFSNPSQILRNEAKCNNSNYLRW